MTDENKRESLNLLATLAALISLSIPVLYLIGHLYYEGYLNAYNQSIDTLSLPIESILLKSFYVISGLILHIFNSVINNLLVIFLIGVGVFLYAMFLIFLANRAEKIKNTFESKKEGFKQSKYFHYGLLPTVVAFFGVGSLLFFALFIFLIFGIFWSSHSYGKKLAEEEIREFQNCGVGNKYICSQIIESSGTKTKGLVIASSDKFIGIYTGEKVVLISNQNLKIETQPKK